MSTRPRLPTWLTGSGVIAIGMGIMNVGTYGFTLLAARVLGPREYGALAALMGLMLVTAVAQPLVVLLLKPGGPLGGYVSALLLAASCLPLTLMGAQAGLLQGERRWFPLAAVYLAVGLGRVLLGLGGMLWR